MIRDQQLDRRETPLMEILHKTVALLMDPVAVGATWIIVICLLFLPVSEVLAGGDSCAAKGTTAGADRSDELDPDDFRISWMGPDGDTAFGAFWYLVYNMSPDVAYNYATNQYLVVWFADDYTPPLVDNEYEIFGQLVDAETSALVGSRFRISFMGPDGDTNYGGLFPVVSYNSTNNEFMVVWVGDHSDATLVNDHFEIFGRRVSSAGALLGTQVRLSDMGSSADPAYGAAWWVPPAIAYNATDNEYLVVWTADTNLPPLVNDEFEIWGRRYLGNLTPVDSSQIRLSAMGPDGDTNYYASKPAIAWDSTHNDFLVVYEGDDNSNGLVNDEVEIFSTFVPGDPATPIIVLVPSQISSMGGANGDADYDAYAPDVAYNTANSDYLIVWVGDDNQWGTTIDEEFEIWGRLLSWDGTLTSSLLRVSAMGQFDGNTAYSANSPAVVSASDSFEIVWHGDDDQFGMVDDEFEIFSAEIPADPLGFSLLIDTRLTTMGVDADTSRGAFDPALAYDFERDRALVVWWGDDNISPAVDDEFEILGQMLGFHQIFSDGFETGTLNAWDLQTP